MPLALPYGDMNLKSVLALARQAEQCECYDDMCEAMQNFATRKLEEDKGEGLESDERNLLSVAYKNVVGGKRQAVRFLLAETGDASEEGIKTQYRALVQEELKVVCNNIIELIKKLVAPLKRQAKDAETDKSIKLEATTNETIIFYMKMMGDYYRYLAEFTNDEASVAGGKSDKEECKECYEEASQLAKEFLAETHPTRLGLALNYSVCQYEILKEKDDACATAKGAFDAAIEKLDTLNDSSYKDSTLIMQLLRDNLTLWTSAQQNNEKGDADGPK